MIFRGGNTMKIIHMIDDYKILCKDIESMGKYEAYKAYIQKYPYFFEGVLKYLYCQPIENLKEMIEDVDFNLLLKTAEENYETGKVDYIIEFMNKFIKKMNVDFDFSFLIGIEMGNIGGCASPCDTGDPHLYIGIDKPIDKENIGMLISHELYHMLRAYMTQESTADTVFSRMVEEGLASYSSLWAHNMEWNTVNIAKTLAVSEKQANNLLNNTNVLLERIVNDGEKPISVETMSDYFVADMHDVEFPVIGYYVGLYLTHLSVEQGIDFERFISMSQNDIIDMWLKQIETLKCIKNR